MPFADGPPPKPRVWPQRTIHPNHVAGIHGGDLLNPNYVAPPYSEEHRQAEMRRIIIDTDVSQARELQSLLLFSQV